MASNRQKAIGAGATGAVLALVGVLVSQWEPARDPNVGYWDRSGHVATACYGHTGGVVVGMRYSDAQCHAWLAADMADALATVNRCIHVPLTNKQAAALVDATYNIGPAVVCGSTLQRLANSGAGPATWCAQLPRWNHAGGRELTGLTRRRQDELQLCLGVQP